MGSAGLQWDATDNPEAARLNQKTNFIGTGAQIAALGTTYAGQSAFCTSTGSGFTVDNKYIRNSANSAWILEKLITDTISESTEGNTTPVTDTGELNPTAGNRYYAFFTLPTTDPLYQITGIEWKNGTAVAGNVIAGIDLVDADPPTNNHTPLVTLVTEVAQTGTSAVQRNSDVATNTIRGGTILGAWISFSSASATYRYATGSSQNQQKATAYDNTPLSAEATAWTASTNRAYIKVYYRSFY